MKVAATIEAGSIFEDTSRALGHPARVEAELPRVVVCYIIEELFTLFIRERVNPGCIQDVDHSG